MLGGRVTRDREGPPLGGDIRDPQLDAEVPQDAEMLFAPTAEADEQHPHGRASPPTSSPIS